MCLIEDDQIPVGVFKYLHVFVTTNEVDGGHNAVVGLENSRVGIEDLTIDKSKRQIELNAHFVLLPLFGQSARGDYEDALHHFAHNHLLDEQTSHNGFSSTCIVGEQKANPWLWQQEFIDCFDLMGQGVNNAAIDGKEWVELIGSLDTLSFGEKFEFVRVAFKVELAFVGHDFQPIQLVGSKNDAVGHVGVDTFVTDGKVTAQGLHFGNYHRFRGDEILDYVADFNHSLDVCSFDTLVLFSPQKMWAFTS